MEIRWKTCLRVGLTVVVSYLCVAYWPFFMRTLGLIFSAAKPLFLGAAMAYVVNIPMNFFERFLPGKGNERKAGLRRVVSLLLAVVSLLLVITLLFSMIIPELTNCLQLIIERLPGSLKSAYFWLDSRFHIDAYLAGSDYLAALENINWPDLINKAVNFFMHGVGGAMDSIVSGVSSVVSATVTGLIAVVFAIYVLVGKERLGAQIRRMVHVYLGDHIWNRFHYVSSTVDACFHSFIVGQCVEAVILGSLCIIGMGIFRFPYAMMIGCLIGFTALIPIAGAYIGAFVGAFMIFTVSPIKSLLFLIFLVVLQQLEGNIIYPKVVGASIGLPGIFVLSAITIGGGMWGIGGMLIGVPIVASLYRLVKNNIENKESMIAPPVQTNATE